jgi:signal transduction histidine kinase
MTSLATVLQQAGKLMEPVLSENHIRYEVICKEDIRTCTYPNELLQAILNIIRNAQEIIVERNIKEGRIVARLKRENELSVITIEDNGGGIDEKIAERIFEPYTSTKSKDGYGLGLYMCKLIVERHCGGTLTFQTTKNGTIFIIKLPIELCVEENDEVFVKMPHYNTDTAQSSTKEDETDAPTQNVKEA